MLGQDDMHEASDLGRRATTRAKVVCASCCTRRGCEAVSAGQQPTARPGADGKDLHVSDGACLTMRSRSEVREPAQGSLWLGVAEQRPSPGTTPPPLHGWTSSCAVSCRRSDYAPLHLRPRFAVLLRLWTKKEQLQVVCRARQDRLAYHTARKPMGAAAAEAMLSSSQREATSMLFRSRCDRRAARRAATAWVETFAHSSPWQQQRQRAKTALKLACCHKPGGPNATSLELPGRNSPYVDARLH